PSRQYVIGSRRCRQRLAQMLAAGKPPERAALVERRSVAEVELLLEDEGFAGLVGHYRGMAELPETEKLAALKAMALDLLHLALQAGDVRAAVFFAYEDLHKRNPAQSLALAAIRGAQGAAEADTPRPEVRRPVTPRAEPRREADFAYCAATRRAPTHAAALAAEEARTLHARVARTGRALTGRLVAEAERAGTA